MAPSSDAASSWAAQVASLAVLATSLVVQAASLADLAASLADLAASSPADRAAALDFRTGQLG